jgi:hypothetical protein
MYTDSIFSIILPSFSESAATFFHLGSFPKPDQLDLASSSEE